MFFNSIDFAIFLPVVFVLYWFVTNKNLELQNFLIVAASYFFYGWWDWRFLSLILFSTLVDYSVGRKLKVEENQTNRKVLLWISILVNLGFLGFFKYLNSANKLSTKPVKILCINIIHSIWEVKNITYFWGANNKWW